MKRLVYIDSLRGIASLIVAIFWHYKHFSNSFQSNSIGLEPPLYWLFPARFFFDYGDIMVDLFFVLSGVIFSYTYRTAVETRRISGYDFFVKRFSRLYPIHLLTLILVALLVNIYHSQNNNFPIYNVNDAYHFVLNLVFLQKGFIDKGYSYNAPAWSLSIEAFMYLLFFIQARYWNVVYTSIFFIIVGLFIYRLPYDLMFLINHPMARGLMGFFSGCLLYETIIKNGVYLRYRWVIMISFGVIILGYTVYVRHYIVLPLHWVMIFVALFLIAESHCNRFIQYFLNNRLFRMLGDISLSLYLIHVPVQIVILLYFKVNQLTIQYDSWLLFIFYSLSAMVSGWILHVAVEKPAQHWLRLKLKV